MEVTYHKEGEYYLPDLMVPEAPKVGRYGMLRRRFLRENRNGTYTAMLLTGRLNQHLEEIDRQANEMMETLTALMAKAGGREREPESGEPDEVGRADEQHPGSSGGNRAEGTGVPVTRDIGAATMRAVGSTGLEVFHDEWYKDSKVPYYHSDG